MKVMSKTYLFFGRGAFIIAGLLPISAENPDNVSLESKTAKCIDDEKKNETGWDRLRKMFTIDEFDNMSPELTTVTQASIMGLFVGACYGGLNRSKVAYLDFMAKNKATAFKSHFDAKKKLQDQVTIGMGKGAFQWGWRLGFFTGTYMLCSTVIAAYRGESGILEHVMAGIITGGTYKSSLGVRGVAVGSVLGGTLGGIAGVCSYSLLKLFGYSMEEIMYWRKHWRDTRRRMIKEAAVEHKYINNDPLVKHYMEKNMKADLLPSDE